MINFLHCAEAVIKHRQRPWLSPGRQPHKCNHGLCDCTIEGSLRDFLDAIGPRSSNIATGNSARRTGLRKGQKF